MISFAIRMVKDRYRLVIFYILGAIAFLEMYIVLFPTIQKQSAQFNDMLKAMPKEMFKAMNIDPATLSFSNLESFLSSEYLSFLWPILAIILAISTATYICVNEIDKGTIETLMSLPVKRSKILIERFLAGLSMLVIFCFFSIFSGVLLASLHGLKVETINYLTTFVGMSIFIFAVYSIAVLFSVIFSEKGRATLFTSGLLIIMYVINIVANLNDSFSNLRYFSIFNYFNGSKLLAQNVLPEYALLALIFLPIVIFVISLYYFKKRDLSV